MTLKSPVDMCEMRNKDPSGVKWRLFPDGRMEPKIPVSKPPGLL